jgi:serine/threonine protein phosphatase PrpC
MRVAGATDVGIEREHNEDDWWADARDGAARVCAVIDGMGGQRSGDIATRLIVESLSRWWATNEPRHLALDERACEGLRRAHDAIVASVANNKPSYGAAAVCLVVADGEVAIAHVGDCRAYRVRDGALEQLTEDHSLVNELIRTGMLTRDERGETYQRYRNVITRSLGLGEGPVIDTRWEVLRPADLFVLCSDGLWALVSNEDILATVLSCGEDFERACATLIALANERGGTDNITVVLARCDLRG